MRNNLPRAVMWNECAIVNLDNVEGSGTHWVAYIKQGDHVEYFDSFGNLRPPLELIQYFGFNTLITYNYTPYQSYDMSNCGQLCVKFLQRNI